MMRSTEALIENIENLGYRTEYGTSNTERPNQQLWVYKGHSPLPIAKVSLMLNCRINTMFNGVGRDEKELLKLLYEYSIRRK
ncbi:hypothetical protein [Companilactobacillus ginsenosidimutans]|uniref:Uncharacterized protein n=1 Tax=Companilactobacillus ginsenosidimutans TaxID=1007676 RepID=A0A0H4QDB9_9LACO|nr:hypothetical protein [Companilactobacillus ginsenosidimutans]AKP66329.1 hypothetical protein ABM34_01350 [Companilactobacillus ginsenosidimutans]